MESNKWTISVKKLEQQFQFLKDNNYQTFHFSELDLMKKIPKKSIVLTFDDVTENQFIHVVPLLEKFNLKASFFIPFFYVGKTDLWNNTPVDLQQKIMSIDQLKLLNAEKIELGYHSYAHKKYESLNASEIENDFAKCEEVIKQSNLKIYPVLAYPFGNYPKNDSQKNDFKRILSHNKIKFGLRIGNRRNTFPFKNRFEIKRIEIEGKDSLMVFRLKIKLGKLKLF
ncbi:polysaccharide deacetylase family protein [Flavobacterium artemisiae]|uniref:Polysaccharide deacetylase family protein n=1 Tax=Flavobacterium artemisiae TaxID=2126556 RepID=A0ABW4HK12_9FLAO